MAGEMIEQIKAKLPLVDYLPAHGVPLQRDGAALKASCPFHSDRTPSFIVDAKANTWSCFGACQAKRRDVINFVMKQQGLDFKQALNLLATEAGVPPPRMREKPKAKVAATYDYRDEDGLLLFQALRYEPKGFSQGYYNMEGEWVPNIQGIRRVLYRLPELLESDPEQPAFIVEGEKDVHSLEALGLVGTSNPMGAGKWLPEYADSLLGRYAVILPDNDEVGRKHAEAVAMSLQGKAKSVNIVELPGLPDKGDVTDWLDLGHTREELLALVEAAPSWEPPKEERVSTPAAQLNTSDLGNRERLIARHGRDLRYCPGWKTWLFWDGKRWARDQVHEIYRRAEDSVRRIYAEADQQEDKEIRRKLGAWALRSESRKRLESMIALARNASEVIITPAQLDADPWSFNCKNGTLDLRTGELREHRREDLITKLAPVDYHPSACLDLWEEFLSVATHGDSDLAEFLQRVAGYALTGSPAEEKLFFVHGPEASGKSTFVEALKATLGEYGITADFEAFLSRRDVGAPRNDIARLAGARFVASIEVDEGKRLAEGLVKMLTGGDTVASRFLYGEIFEFKPQFKLFLAANHAPKVREDDGAMWRRILRIPFEQSIPEGERDPKVKATLRDPARAGSAILAWALKGCLAWQKEGLGVPSKVVRATNEYRDSMDPLKGFLDEYCVLGPGYWVSTGSLRSTYEKWAKESGFRDILQGKAWGDHLRAKGCEPEQRRVGDPESGHTQIARGWRGIGLLDAVDPDAGRGQEPGPGFVTAVPAVTPDSLNSPYSLSYGEKPETGGTFRYKREIPVQDAPPDGESKSDKVEV